MVKFRMATGGGASLAQNGSQTAILAAYPPTPNNYPSTISDPDRPIGYGAFGGT